MKSLFVCACGHVHCRPNGVLSMIHCTGCGGNYLWQKNDDFPDNISNEAATELLNKIKIPVIFERGKPIMMKSGHEATFFDGAIFDMSDMEINKDLFFLHEQVEEGCLSKLPKELQDRAIIDELSLSDMYSKEQCDELRLCIANLNRGTVTE